MELTTETKLDFDYSVGDEDRFAIRRVLDKFAVSANQGDIAVLDNLISDSTVIEGFSDLPYVKQEFLSILSRRHEKGKKHVMRFPKLKLTYTNYLYHLKGTFEEFVDNILATEGTIELSMIKQDDNFQLVKIAFYPRMRLSED